MLQQYETINIKIINNAPKYLKYHQQKRKNQKI